METLSFILKTRHAANEMDEIREHGRAVLPRFVCLGVKLYGVDAPRGVEGSGVLAAGAAGCKSETSWQCCNMVTVPHPYALASG